MSNPIMFKDLPATFPEKDRYQKPSLLGSIAFHVLLVVVLVILPLMFPHSIEQWQLMTLLVAPPPPPPAAPPAPVEVEAAPKPEAPKVFKQVQVDPGALIAPLVVPKDIAHIVDDPMDALSGVIGGVPGGMPGGVVGGILGGVLAANAKADIPLPPPPPPPPVATPVPPPPKEAIRVGGMIKEPKIIKLVPPIYPPLASKARVSGMVVLEAMLTTEGTVEEIRVISGHPLLINAAIDCVKQWIYEPTYLNGQPVAVILTAKVSFYQKPAL